MMFSEKDARFRGGPGNANYIAARVSLAMNSVSIQGGGTVLNNIYPPE